MHDNASDLYNSLLADYKNNTAIFQIKKEKQAF